MKNLAVVFAAMFATTLLWAQTGDIQGRILDPYDGGLAKAKVVVVDSAGNAVKKLTANTDFAGDYTLKSLPAGIYNVQITLKGYTNQIQSNVIVSDNKTTFLNFRLHPANTLSK